MSTEILRRAATLMRERAEAASSGPWTCYDAKDWYGGGPAWEVDYIPTEGLCEGEEVQVSGGSGQADATHIASWHPAVALAVADWLDAVADRCLTIHNSTPSVWYSAVTVARAYLGEAS